MVRTGLVVLTCFVSVATALVVQTGGDSGGAWTVLTKQHPATGDSSERAAGQFDRLGKSFEKRNMLDSALNCYKAALEIYRKLNLPTPVSTEYSRISTLYSMKGKKDDALANISQAVAYASKSTDSSLLEPLLLRKAEVFTAKNYPDSAALYYQKAIALCVGIKDCRKGQILFDMGTVYNNNLLPDSAAACWLQAAAAYGIENNPEGRGKAFNDCGVYYAKKKSYPEALHYLDSALAAFNACKFDRGVDETRNMLGTVWFNYAVQRFNGGDAAGASAALDEAAGYSFSKQFSDAISKFRDDIRKSR